MRALFLSGVLALVVCLGLGASTASAASVCNRSRVVRAVASLNDVRDLTVDGTELPAYAAEVARAARALLRVPENAYTTYSPACISALSAATTAYDAYALTQTAWANCGNRDCGADLALGWQRASRFVGRANRLLGWR